ncbi:hypothetical protein [Allopusillimonas ginsengisoli]|uniref:hypothetical protein n=1 Tax=Allopusillimonas ginsengisoli TaxID=453575 RepID=UPI00101FDFE4|nr:hypothetical protein [Allopusillimonas ginsengisoli]TEA78639.1 hypothetical protein ERE07_09590 [Allopusillimonas ginsengisoli]
MEGMQVRDGLTLYVVGAAHIDQAWREGAHKLSEATKRAQGEVTADQLKMQLARGELTLLCLRGDQPDSWYAVEFIQKPNMRVLFIHAMAASGATTNEAMQLIDDYARSGGASAIDCACYGAAARIFARFGFNEIYSIARKPLWLAAADQKT